MTKVHQQLDPQQANNLFKILKQRFQTHMERHEHIRWADIHEQLLGQPDKLWSLHHMELSGGEPDVAVLLNTQALYFFDCALESPKGRRSMCYDQEALLTRKDHPPENTVMDWVKEHAVMLMTESQYYALQQLFSFDLKTSSWVETPNELRQQGGAIFCDRRYGRTFSYHNGAASYYASRGFRTYIKL